MEDKLKRQPTGEYPVGYCRPPRRTKSDKPRTPAPDLEAPLLEDLYAALSKTVTGTENGRRRKMTKGVFIAKALANDAIKDPAANKALLNLFAGIDDLVAAVEKPPTEERPGILLVYAAYQSVEAWFAEARATKLPLNPLEGIPGAEQYMLAAPPKPADYDPTEDDFLQPRNQDSGLKSQKG